MMHLRPLAFPFLLLPGAAAADVTPQDVWDNMVAGYGAFGFELNAALETTGDRLIANDAVVALTYPVVGGQMTITLPPMTLTALGDGTVSITSPGTYVASLNAEVPQEEGTISADVTVSQDGTTSIASGVPGDVTYTSQATNFDMLVTSLNVPDQDFDNFSFQLDSEGYASVTQVTEGDAETRLTSQVTNNPAVTTMNMEVAGILQESVSTAGSIESTFAAVIPANTDIMNLAPALRAGLSITGTSNAEGSTSVSKTFERDMMTGEQTQVTGPSVVSFGMDATGLRTDATSQASTFVLSGDQFMLPFPVEIAMQAVSAKFNLPLLASDAQQSVDIGLAMTDVTISDDIWGLIDQGGQLDRSPLSLAIDLSGDVLLSSDLVDPETLAQIENGAMPLQPLGVAINELGFSALGAVISATGAFTFDMTDMQTFNGMPRPEGQATARAEGLNAAIDQLVAAGLIAEQDAMMPRMFMGMFAVAEGNDVLSTQVEINRQGHVLLNGQRVQ